MKTQLPAGQSKEHLRTLRQRRLAILSILLILDALVLGGCVTLLVVRQLLLNIMQRLITFDAQAEILNVLDHLIPYYVVYGGTLLALILITVGAYVWLMTKSRLLRYGVVLLGLILVAGIAWMLLSGSTGTPPPPPMTPTPVAQTTGPAMVPSSNLAGLVHERGQLLGFGGIWS